MQGTRGMRGARDVRVQGHKWCEGAKAQGVQRQEGSRM